MKMKSAMRIAARVSRREGKLTEQQYRKIMIAIRHPNQKKPDGTPVNLMEEIEAHVTQEMGKQGLAINWPGVIQWFKDHWLQILSLLSLISLL
jgi:hypothetical protein